MLKRVLYIEDDSGLASLLQKRMQRVGLEVQTVESAEAALSQIDPRQFDTVLIDYQLPGMNGLELISHWILAGVETPLILLTASGDERIAVQAMETGAADYVIKDVGQAFLDLLPAVMQAAFTRIKLQRQTQNQQEAIVEYASKLRDSEERLNLATEGSEIGIWDWDLQHESFYWSTAMKTAYSVAEDEAPHYERWMAYAHPEDRARVEECFTAAIEGRVMMCHVEYREHTVDSTSNDDWRWAMVRGVVARDMQGKPYRMLGTRLDVTDRKRLEVQLEREKKRAEEANHAKTDFLAAMSHEIRTPMNAVIGLAGLLAKTPLTAKQQEMVGTLSANTEMLLKIINDLLDISRIEAGQIELEHTDFCLSDVLRELQLMFGSQVEGKGIAFNLHDTTASANFKGDRTRIQQVLMNLCGNAIKFTREGGITLSAEAAAGDPAAVTLKVSDTGIGIPKEKIESIFEQFVQADETINRRFGGSGLGLAICRTLATLMGGTITVESEHGKGSTFTFALTLPRVQAIDAAKRLNPAPKPLQGNTQATHTQRVLLVEDYPANVMVATLMLESLNYPYDVATSGKEALALVEKTSATYTAVLMDVQMQDMDGFETTRRLRSLEQSRKWPAQHIIGLTAHALAGDRERCLAAGMNDYMTKPIHFQELAEKLADVAKAA